RTGEELSAGGVVAAFLAKCLADALGNATMRLPVQDQRIDRAADVVERGVADERDGAGVGIDLDFADVSTERKAAAGEGDVRYRAQRPAQVVRQVIAGDRCVRHLEQV